MAIFIVTGAEKKEESVQNVCTLEAGLPFLPGPPSRVLGEIVYVSFSADPN